MKRATCIAAAVFCILIWETKGSEPQDGASTPWSEIAVDDLHFIRATLRENHPGPIDSDNPSFREWHKNGFEEALQLAADVKDYSSYYFAIQHYTQGFQDGHLGALAEELIDEQRLTFRWPGFLLAYDNDAFVVVDGGRSSQHIPEAGATLVGCDGTASMQFAESWLQKYVGLWSVRGARFDVAPYMLVDAGNPFVQRPKSCQFERDGERVQVTLDWRPLSAMELKEYIDAARQIVAPPIGIRSFGKHGYWIALSTFNASNDEADAGLQTIIREFTERGDDYKSAEMLVFDVRGNGGGSSSYGTRIASAVWGQEYVSAKRPLSKAVDWRASPGNVRFLRDFNLARSIRRFGAEDPRVKSYESFVVAIENAAKRGDTFYRSALSSSTSAVESDPVSAKVFFLTDSRCKSACLDFADIMKSMPGVIHVGGETSADAIYIDNRSERLPSGLGRIGFSMKVYRGRPRGHNTSYVPEHLWSGRMDDTAGLEAWIANLRIRED